MHSRFTRKCYMFLLYLRSTHLQGATHLVMQIRVIFADLYDAAEIAFYAILQAMVVKYF